MEFNNLFIAKLAEQFRTDNHCVVRKGEIHYIYRLSLGLLHPQKTWTLQKNVPIVLDVNTTGNAQHTHI